MPPSVWRLRHRIGLCDLSAFASSPPAIADDTLAAATIVWNYVGELIFNMLVLVGAIKMSDRIIRELMGLVDSNATGPRC